MSKKALRDWFLKRAGVSSVKSDYGRFPEAAYEWEKTKKETAYHEAGHLIVGHAEDPLFNYKYVTISPHRHQDDKEDKSGWGFNGYVLYDVEKRSFSNPTSNIISSIIFSYGGMAAEMEVFGDSQRVEVGCAKDLEDIRKYAETVVCQGDGLSKFDDYAQEAYSMFNEYNPRNVQSIESMWRRYNKQDFTPEEFEECVSEIMNDSKVEAFGIVQDNRELLDVLALELLEKETLYKEEVEQIFEKHGYPQYREDTEAKETLDM